jgi:hypothetical protein
MPSWQQRRRNDVVGTGYGYMYIRYLLLPDHSAWFYCIMQPRILRPYPNRTWIIATRSRSISSPTRLIGDTMDTGQIPQTSESSTVVIDCC